MATFEGAEAARSTATGMAAVTTALMGQVKAGDHVVAAKALFGSCRWVVEEWLPRFGVPSTLVDGTDLVPGRRRCGKNTKACFLEIPTNPTLEVDRYRGSRRDRARGRRQAGGRQCVRHAALAEPLALGADCVVYSATKHIDGQGRCSAASSWHRKNSSRITPPLIRQTGPSLSPFNAWVLLKGLETLPLRVQRQTETAGAVSTALDGHKKISRLIYPGRPTTRRPTYRQADARRLDAVLRSRSRAASKAPSASSTRLQLIASPTISATPRAWSRTRRRPRISG